MKNLNGLKQGSLLAAMIASTMVATGCGQDPAGPTTTIKSAAYGAPGVGMLSAAMAEGGSLGNPALYSGLASITEFNICVTDLKLEGEGGTAVSDDDGDDLFEARIGLVRTGDGSTAPTWGSASLPVGSTISKLKVEIHHDPETCGVAYSARLNDQEITQDVEMVFAFTTPKVLAEGETITLDMDAIVAAFSGAYDAGDFNDSSITSYIETLAEGSASDD